MDLIEFIGFLITIIAMFLLTIKRVREKRKELPDHEPMHDDQQKQTLKELLKKLDIDVEDEDEEALPPPPPPPRPKVQPAHPQVKQGRFLSEGQYQFRDKLQDYRPVSAIEKRKLKPTIEDPYQTFTRGSVVSPDMRVHEDGYHEIQKEKPSGAARLVSRLHSKKDMIIYQEIMNRPLSMRDNHRA
jgi:hypothetical protein